MGSEISTKPPVLFKKIKSEDYDDGQIIQCISGTIIALYEVRKGDTFEFQNGKMKDAEGTELDISFSKNTQPGTAKGKCVTIRSVKTDQHGWNGIKVEDQSFTPAGKDEPVNKRVVKITASANIVYEEGAPAGKAGTGAPTGGQDKRPQTTSDVHPETFLIDAANLHSRCYHYAMQAYPMPTGASETPQLAAIRQACTASLFIEACRNGYAHNYVERASKPIPPKITPPPADPKLWKSCMIPKGEMTGKTLNDLTDDQFRAFYDAMKDKSTPMANCVKAGFEERGLLKKDQAENAVLDPTAEDDIPF